LGGGRRGAFSKEVENNMQKINITKNKPLKGKWERNDLRGVRISKRNADPGGKKTT